MKARTLLAASAVCLGLTGFSTESRADAIVTGQWYQFSFDGTGSALTSCAGLCSNGLLSIDAPTSPWTINLPKAMLLVVTDGFQQGDEFEFFDFGTSIGSTSQNANNNTHSCDNDELACFADLFMSHGEFLLLAGQHSLTGTVTDSPFGGGAAFFIVTQSVPEPGTLALLASALGGLGFVRRRAYA